MLNIRISHVAGGVEKTIDISEDGDRGLNIAPSIGSSAVVADPVAKLEWSKTLCDGKSVDYETAEKACTALGDGWRVPTRMELESILDLTRHDPAIDTTRFPDTNSAWYWTSTPCAWDASCAWIVNFLNGNAYNSRRSYGACVRAVRSVPAGQ
ncbi:MAG TPA: DUF1566 domain-containing protein [Rhodanobacteraceae bacterium]|nr:DUF1566 domain-containing protein [Rhodanobacteraceae bacterium]